jgi:hypothetical protein
MGFYDSSFGEDKPRAVKSHQLPSDIVCKEFGEVDIRRLSDRTEVFFTILMEPQGVEAEGWQTGLALDASASMIGAYGISVTAGPKGDVPIKLLLKYSIKGWANIVKQDGRDVVIYTDAAVEDALERGYMRRTENEVESLAREMTAYLASSLDADGGTTVIYWACGQSGNEFEECGDFTAEQCKTIMLGGPQKTTFGNGTHLLPAMKYFVDRFKDAKRGMYIFITDGKLDDLDEVKRYTEKLAKSIAAGEHNFVKCVLIGVGSEIDEDQMEELDDLETGTNVDIWDHKIAKEMRSLIEIFAEVVSENQIVAPSAKIYDESGNVAQQFSDGLPAKVMFTLPVESNSFELEVAGRRIMQTIQSRKD